MNELIRREEREKILRFFPGSRDVLLLSALEGYGGRVFESADGNACLVLTGGFVFLGGQAREGFFREASACFPKCFLTFSGSPAWLEIARRWGAEVRMTRYHLETPGHFDLSLLEKLACPPPGFVLKTGDETGYRQCLAASWSEDLASFYSDGEAFARDGLMIGAYRDGELAAGCGVYARTDWGVEIEIDTAPAFRRLGLARCCGARFLLCCLEKNLVPHWDAMTPVSAALACQLGFLRPRPYRVVCREETRAGKR